MKKTAVPFLAQLLFGALLLLAACRDGGTAEQATSEPAQDSTAQQAATAPVDSLAAELDQTAEEIEQETEALKSALDSL